MIYIGFQYHETSPYFNSEITIANVSTVMCPHQELHETWEVHEDLVQRSGTITGPSYSMAIYLQLFHDYPDRWVYQLLGAVKVL